MSSESEDLCSLHFDKLKLFCLNHQEPICLVCRDSKAHNKHQFSPVNEASQDHKQNLQDLLKPLQQKRNLCERVKEKFSETVEHVKVQVQNTERQIKEDFKKFHQFLQEEEEARIKALKEEAEQKTKLLEQIITELSREIINLSHIIRVSEDELRAEGVSFLKNYKASKKRIQQYPLLDVPQPVPGALIDQAKHLGNLSHNIWTKMKEMVSYTPVILDPNTAEAHLIVSEDLTSVRFGQKQKLPDNPERFDQHHCVLGSEGFNSGTHSWDVEVTNDRFWGVGVMKQSVVKRGQTQTDYWEVNLHDGKYSAASPPLQDKILPVKNLQRVRVLLDWEKGRLSFFDLDTKKLLHIFKQTFTEKMFPYFGIRSGSSVKILPLNISMTEEHEFTLSPGIWGF